MARIPRFTSILDGLGLIFTAFLCLLFISVAVAFMGLDAQKQEARIINLAGRQRMLLQQMTGLAQSYESGDENRDASALLNAASTFEQTLSGLSGGGRIVDYTGESFEIARPTDAALRSELEEMRTDWQSYRAKIDRLVQSRDEASIESSGSEIRSLSPQVIAQADRVVRAFEADSTATKQRLHTYDVILLLGGTVLLAIGWFITSISIVQPLSRLEKSARRIGEGNLSSPVQVEGPSEVRVLSSTIETMRAQILVSQQDLKQWADTLENRVQQRTRELEALASVSQEINSHLSIGDVLTSVTEKARMLLGSEVAFLCLLDPQGKMLNLHAAAAPESAIRANQSPANHPAVEKVLEDRCARPCGIQSCQGFCQIIDPAYRTSHLAAPLYRNEKVIGALCAGSSRADAFRPEMEMVLRQLSDAAAVALENSRLYQQAESVAALEERQRIASEMHDGLLQTLSFLRLMSQMLPEQLREGDSGRILTTMGKIERAEEQAEREIREAIASMQVDYPLNDTLQERLHVLVKELALPEPPVTFETHLTRPLVLPQQESEQVLRVAREAILNAQRYSQAKKVFVALEKCGNAIVLSIRDQGTGFNPAIHCEDGRAHFGLKIMQARAARLGGELSIQSSPGTGTLVELRWTPAASQAS